MNLKVTNNCCSSNNIKDETCPECGFKGREVPLETVKSLVINFPNKSAKQAYYSICMNPHCDVVYFDNADKVFFKSSGKRSNLVKSGADPKYACYCSKVTEKQVIDTIVRKGATTVKKVNAITGDMQNANCKYNNPLGICCHEIIQDIISKYNR